MSRSDEPAGASPLAATVRELANEIADPCSLAQGVPIGLADMGLVTAVEERRRADGRADVTVRLRVTAPGCLYGSLFARSLLERLEALAEVAAADVVLGDTWTWTPDDIAASARERLAERRRQLLAAVAASH